MQVVGVSHIGTDWADYYKKTGTAPPDSDQPEGMDQPLGENGSHDLVPRVEAAPEGKQVFIKTVPPSTERLDLEEASVIRCRRLTQLTNRSCPSSTDIYISPSLNLTPKRPITESPGHSLPKTLISKRSCEKSTTSR